MPGEYAARIAGTTSPSTDGYLLDVTRDVKIEPGNETELRVELPTGGRVRVKAVNRQGEVVIPPWDVTLQNEKGWLLTGHLGRLTPRGTVSSATLTEPVETMKPVKPGRAFVVILSCPTLHETHVSRFTRSDLTAFPPSCA